MALVFNWHSDVMKKLAYLNKCPIDYLHVCMCVFVYVHLHRCQRTTLAVIPQSFIYFFINFIYFLR